MHNLVFPGLIVDCEYDMICMYQNILVACWYSLTTCVPPFNRFCSTPAVALSRNIPRKHAMRMLLTGELISAKKALAYGLVNDAVAPEMLELEITKLAERISSQSKFAICLGKNMFYEQLKYDDLGDAYEYAVGKVEENMKHPDAKQGIDDFVNKKKR